MMLIIIIIEINVVNEKKNKQNVLFTEYVNSIVEHSFHFFRFHFCFHICDSVFYLQLHCCYLIHAQVYMLCEERYEQELFFFWFFVRCDNRI